MAARRNARTVEMQDFEKAKDKILMGPERKSKMCIRDSSYTALRCWCHSSELARAATAAICTP